MNSINPKNAPLLQRNEKAFKMPPMESKPITNRSLLLPYCAPYLAFVALASVPDDILPAAGRYLIQLVLVSGLLTWAWRWYIPLKGPRPLWESLVSGLIAGLIGCALWVLLLLPFVDAGGDSWRPLGFGLRLVTATLVVPVFEEILMRGFILRLTLQWDRARRDGIKHPLQHALDEKRIDEVAPGDWSSWAVVISTIAFAAGHTMVEWPAAVAYGFLMALLWIWRKDLVACIVAHGTTNLALAIYVKVSGSWGLW